MIELGLFRQPQRFHAPSKNDEYNEIRIAGRERLRWLDWVVGLLMKPISISVSFGSDPNPLDIG